MAIVTTDSQNYAAIADAIRNKGVSGVFKPSEMAQAVEDIPIGGGLPEGIAELYTGTFTPTENMTTYTVTHNLGKYPKVFLCFLDVPRIHRPGEKVMSFYIYFVGQNTETSGYLTQYTGASTGNLSGAAGAAGIPAGTTINEIPMTALRGRFVSTLADVDNIIVPAVYRWVFLV